MDNLGNHRFSLGRDFYAVQTAGMLNSMAARCVQFALAWWILAITNDTTAFSLFVTVAAGAEILARGLFGWLGDAYSRRMLIGACYLASLVSILAIALLASTGEYWPALLLVGQVCIGLAVGIREPIQGSIVVMLVPKRQLSEAIRWRSGALTITNFCSPIVATLLISVIGSQGTMWCSAALVAVSLTALRLVDQPTDPLNRAKVPNALRRTPRWSGGFSAIWNLPPEMSLLRATFFLNLGLYPFFSVALPAYFQQNFSQSPWLLGVAESAFSLGLFFGATKIGVVANRSFDRATTTFVGYTVMGVGILVASLFCQFLSKHSICYFAPMCLALCIAGCGLTVATTNTNFLRSAATPDSFLNRVGAAAAFGTGLANPIGVALAGCGAAVIGMSLTLIVLGLILVVASALAFTSSSLRTMLSMPDGQIHDAYSRLYPDVFSKEVENATH